mgnify:CR=1 FL=1
MNLNLHLRPLTHHSSPTTNRSPTTGFIRISREPTYTLRHAHRDPSHQPFIARARYSSRRRGAHHGAHLKYCSRLVARRWPPANDRPLDAGPRAAPGMTWSRTPPSGLARSHPLPASRGNRWGPWSDRGLVSLVTLRLITQLPLPGPCCSASTSHLFPPDAGPPVAASRTACSVSPSRYGGSHQ